jgi:hypothetical protein
MMTTTTRTGARPAVLSTAFSFQAPGKIRLRHILSRVVFAWLGILVLAAGAFAQPDAGTRMVEGRVLDGSGQAVVGAVVQIKDLKSLQVRSFITQADGAYHFTGLSTNSDYELTARKENQVSKTKTLRAVDEKKKATIDLTLK